MPSRQAAPSAEDDSIVIRPMRGDGEQTRARIIETAGHLMAENGFAQTTSKSICEAAQVNMAAINYYFGSREGLYIAVLEDVHDRLLNREFLERLADEAIPARRKMQRILAALCSGLTAPQQQWLMRAWAREIVAPSEYLQDVMRRVVCTKVQIVKDIVSEMTGIPQSKPELECCLISALGPFMLLLVTDRKFLQLLVPRLCHTPGIHGYMGEMAMIVLDAAARSWQQRGKLPTEFACADDGATGAGPHGA